MNVRPTIFTHGDVSYLRKHTGPAGRDMRVAALSLPVYGGPQFMGWYGYVYDAGLSQSFVRNGFQQYHGVKPSYLIRIKIKGKSHVSVPME